MFITFNAATGRLAHQDDLNGQRRCSAKDRGASRCPWLSDDLPGGDRSPVVAQSPRKRPLSLLGGSRLPGSTTTGTKPAPHPLGEFLRPSYQLPVHDLAFWFCLKGTPTQRRSPVRGTRKASPGGATHPPGAPLTGFSVVSV
eukprot:959667-Prorocentrum_minimum.AAC.1